MNICLEHLKNLFQEGKMDELAKTAARFLTSGALTKEEDDEILDFFVNNLPDEVIEKVNKARRKKG